MKTLLNILIAFCCLLHTASATVLTVSNHPLGGAQYSDLGSAINDANPGDTCLIEGTSIAYGINVWDKPLVFIGQGFNAQKQGFQTTKFIAAPGTNCSVCFRFDPGASGSKFYGITFIPAFFTFSSASNLYFENCKFQIDLPLEGECDNLVFRNCIFEGGLSSTNPNSLNWLISNCVINGPITGSGTPQYIIIDHCLFLSADGSFSNADNVEVKNSIFMNSTGLSGISNSNFQNNLTRLPSTFPPAGNQDVGGNLVGVDPQMVSYDFNTSYSTAHDYHLLPGSPALGGASDGTEIGVHGGFTFFSEQGEPLNAPVIRSMNLVNTSVSPGGTMHVTVVATKPDDN